MSEKSHGKRAEVPVGAKPKPPIWLPDAELASGVQVCGRKQAGRVYTAVVRDAKMEIPANRLLKNLAEATSEALRDVWIDDEAR